MISESNLNAQTPEGRRAALQELAARRSSRPVPSIEVNCHVHTIYSFSPYSPASAAAHAQEAGLAAVGIMDHDSIAGADEMAEAGRILGIATTAGVELRVSAVGTALEGRRINNPDSRGILYMMMHGAPARSFAEISGFLAPLQSAREKRGQRMLEALNALLPGYDLPRLDWNRDVRSCSQADAGGTITERHILFALATLIVRSVGKGPQLAAYIENRLGIGISPRLAAFISDDGNEALLYDLLGVLKSSFLEKIFIQPTDDECVPVGRVVEFAERVGAIPTYAYLGDITDSPTGDKKAEQFEDSYLDELMKETRRLGFRAIAYMPPRNSLAQLRRVRALCAQHGFMEISGVDINSPRQSFNCPELRLPEFSHLLGATWALIAHERLGQEDPRYSLFHPDNPLAAVPLGERLAAYAEVGRSLDPSRSRSALENPLVQSWK